MRRNAVTPARRSINRTGGDTSSQEGFINSSVLTGFLVIGVAAVLAMLFWLPYWLVSELLGLPSRRPHVS